MANDVSVSSPEELTIVQLAREIAMDIRPFEEILKLYQITPERYETLKSNPRFIALVESEVAAWNGSLNTQERLKLKSASMLEEYLPELNARLHDPKELLSSKLEGAKLVARLAGAGLNGFGVEGVGGERFSITINLGGSEKLTFNKEVTPKTIDGEVADAV